MRIEGLSTLVTGGASGLGLATARRLVKLGASVVIADLPNAPGATEAAELGRNAAFVPTDITDPEQVDAALFACEQFGPVRAVVHCAGRGGDRLRIIDEQRAPASLDSFAEVVRVNLTGTYNVITRAASRMSGNELLDGDRGAIVLTASVAAFEGRVGTTSYVASKAGVHGITLVSARDLATWQIRVNSIAPGIFDTPMVGRLQPDVQQELAASIPHPHRLGDGDDFAQLAVFMIESTYVNGETVRLDGAFRG